MAESNNTVEATKVTILGKEEMMEVMKPLHEQLDRIEKKLDLLLDNQQIVWAINIGDLPAVLNANTDAYSEQVAEFIAKGLPAIVAHVAPKQEPSKTKFIDLVTPNGLPVKRK